jgi:hypothetical protein
MGDPERCSGCGFDGSRWTDAEALDEIAGLAARWADAVQGLDDVAACRRPVPAMWSIAEYTDHIREVMFGMRLLAETAVTSPGADLGPSPETPFDPEPRRLDLARAQAGFAREAAQLHGRLAELAPELWCSQVVLDGEAVDIGWIVRHAVHDALHHLGDLADLREALRAEDR